MMKKFDRLPPQQRKAEIKAAAAVLFREKGFPATTMENIVQRVSLSKGGVYRIYPSTTDILSDLMLDGMRLRNAFYEQRTREQLEEGKPLTLSFLVHMICDSLLLYPEVSEIYVEFLWEKRRNPRLQGLYTRICQTSVEETVRLMQTYGADRTLLDGAQSLELLTELMNTAILGIDVLGLRESFAQDQELIAGQLTAFLLRKAEQTVKPENPEQEN